MKKKLIYLDNAATCPTDKAVMQTMKPYYTDYYGNPSALYSLGRKSRQAIERAKNNIAQALNCSAEEIFFTSGATESDNLAIFGVARSYQSFGKKVIISAVEHKSIASAANALEKEGFEVVKIAVKKDGLLDLRALKKELDKQTILVSITYADSETGTIQPIQEIVKIIKQHRLQHATSLPFFHSDAAQAFYTQRITPHRQGIDVLTISGNKIGGPKGIAALFVKKGISLQPIIYGGGQQGTVRSGTENVPAIVGFAKAVGLIEEKKNHSALLKKKRDYFERKIFENIKKVVLNGHPTQRLENFLNLSFLDIEGEAILLYLDEYGIMASTGSACDSDSLEPSSVLIAQGNPYEFIHGSIRFSLGYQTSYQELDYTLKILDKVVKKLRLYSPLSLELDDRQHGSTYYRSKEWNPKKRFIKSQKNDGQAAS